MEDKNKFSVDVPLNSLIAVFLNYYDKIFKRNLVGRLRSMTIKCRAHMIVLITLKHVESVI